MSCPGWRNQWSSTEGSPRCPLTPATKDWHWTPTPRAIASSSQYSSITCPPSPSKIVEEWENVILSRIKDGGMINFIACSGCKLSHGQQAEQEEFFSFFYIFLPFLSDLSAFSTYTLTSLLWRSQQDDFEGSKERRALDLLGVWSWLRLNLRHPTHIIGFHSIRTGPKVACCHQLPHALACFVWYVSNMRWKSGEKPQNTNEATLRPEPWWFIHVGRVLTIEYLLIVLSRQRNNVVSGFFYNVGQIWHKLLLLILHVEIVDCFVLVFHIENFFVDRKLLSWHSEKELIHVWCVLYNREIAFCRFRTENDVFFLCSKVGHCKRAPRLNVRHDMPPGCTDAVLTVPQYVTVVMLMSPLQPVAYSRIYLWTTDLILPISDQLKTHGRVRHTHTHSAYT